MKPTHVERLYRSLAEKVSELAPDRRRALTRSIKQMNAGRLTSKLRNAVAKSDRTPAAIAWDAGMNPSQMYRFLDGATITLETADRLAELLGLDLTPATSTTKKKAAKLARASK